MKPTIDIGDRLIPDGYDRTAKPMTVVLIYRGWVYTTRTTYAPGALPLNAPTSVAGAKAHPHYASRFCRADKVVRVYEFVWEDCKPVVDQIRDAASALGLDRYKADVFLKASPSGAVDILDHLKAIAAILKETP